MSMFDKAKEFLNTEKGEEISDQILDKVADAAESKLGADKSEQIRSAREQIDARVGNEGAAGVGEEPAQPAEPVAE